MTIELKELQESARQVLDGADVAAAEDQTWSQLVELGWLLVPIPEDLGGLGLGAEGACTVQAELGRKLATVPYLSALLAIEAFCQSDHGEREAWLERISGGEFVAAPLADSPLALAQAGGKLTLSGSATAVQSADKADHMLVWIDDQVALVPMAEGNVTVIERPTWDRTRRLFDVRFENVELDEKLVLASGNPGETLARRLSTLRDYALAADALGGADSLLELTVEHLGTREQFGRPLAMFQALKHRCADLKAQLAGAEAVHTASLGEWAEQLGEPEAVTRGEKAKYLACSAFAAVAEESLQLHGGIGMASEHPCHLYLKRALLSEQLGRSADSYDMAVADALLEAHS